MSDILQQLIEEIPIKELSSILKKCEETGKKRIGKRVTQFYTVGSANNDKVSRSFLYNTIANDELLKSSFLEHIINEYNLNFEKDMSIEDVKTIKTDCNLYGIIAFCLLKNNENFTQYAETLLNESVPNPENSDESISDEVEFRESPKNDELEEEICMSTNATIDTDLILRYPSVKNDYELLKTFSMICEENDLYFESKDLNNLHTALKTGKLVILSGMSGTGKSAIVDMYTRALGLTMKANSPRVLTIPVRPAWNDDSDLLGYMDLVHMVYRPSDNGFVKLLVEASKKENQNKLYFVCFDEMNLARVEHYFSQFLSILEKPVGERTLRLYDEQYIGRLYNSSEYPDVIELNDNIRFIGTVNIDESTFNFADKVLDRANVITLHILPFNSWKKRSYTTKERQEWTCEEYKKLFVSNNKWDSHQLKEFLWEMHILFQQISNGMGVGPRVVKSIETYLEMLSDEVGEFSLSKEEGIDLQVKQRILTKIRGSSEQCKQLFENKEGATIEAIFDKYSELSSFEESRKTITQKKKELDIYGYCI